MSAIGFGDNTVQPFNSSWGRSGVTDTPYGPVKIDWYTNIQASGGRTLALLNPGGGVAYTTVAYVAGKLIWSGIRTYTGAPITNFGPFGDAAETNTFLLTLNPATNSYSDIFTPAFMAANCPTSGG